MSSTAPGHARQRLRLRYRKDEVLMYTGHLDLLRLVVRWLRRAEVPFATSGKFSPKPRLTFGPVLPLGVMGDAELLDLELMEGIWLDRDGQLQLLARLQNVSAPRDFARQLTELAPHEQPVSGAAVLAGYALEYDTAESAALALASLQSSDLTYTAKNGKRRSDHEAIVELGLDGPAVRVLGRCAGENQLNILRLARAAASRTGSSPLRQRRTGLFNSERQPL